MSQENKEKKGFLEKPTSRREFLKLGCKGVAGAVVSFSLLSLFTDNAEAEGYATPVGLVIADPSRCTGCRRCETNCTVFNDGKAQPYISRVKVARNYNFGQDGPKTAYWKEDGHFGNFKVVPETCRQCKEPKCAEECPMGAISAHPKTGARVVDETKCVGCGWCHEVCPWHIPTVDPEREKSTKCTLCNGTPSCAAGCPTGALKYIPWKEVAAVVRRHRGLNA